MKSLLFILFFLSHQSHSYILISDLDDTLKITNAKNLLPASYNGVFTKKLFSGVKSYLLGTELQRDKLFIVSASPSILYQKVQDLFLSNNIDFDQIILRKKIKEDKFIYKVKAIEKILQTETADVVFLGDDVDKDPEVFAEITKRFPGRVKSVYIRTVRSRSFSGTPFTVMAEVANLEFWQGRLDLVSLFQVLQDHKVDPIKKIIPKFAWCPSNLEWKTTCESTLASDCSEISKRIEHHCQIKTQ